MKENVYQSPAIYIDELYLSKFALLLVVVLLLSLIVLLLIGAPQAIRKVRG